MALEQPKRPVGGAYGVYLAQHRPEFTAALKGQRASAVAKMAGEKWGKLSDKDKAPYEKEFQVIKAKYEKDMKAFLESGGEKKLGAHALATQKRKAKEEGKGGKRRRLAKDPNRPKKPAGGAYGVFFGKNRQAFMKECPGSIAAAGKLAGERWRALGDSQKKPFEEEYKKLLAAYTEAMKNYKPPAGAEENEGGEDEDEEGEEEEEEADPAIAGA